MKNFTLIQKLAILKGLDAVMMADGKVEPGEEDFLKEVLMEMELEPFMVDEARKVSVGESIEILKRMSPEKKRLFAEMMHRMIIADNKVDEREVNLLISLFQEASIDIEKPAVDVFPRDITMIHLESNSLNIYDEGLDGARKNVKRKHDIRIELLPFEENVYKLFISEKGMGMTFWGSDIVEPPVEMVMKENKDDRVVFTDAEKKDIEVSVNFEGPDIRSILIRYGEKGRFVEYLE